VLPVACFWAAPALAQTTVRQECKELSAEDSARVETRLRASLLAPEAGNVDMSIACDGGIAVVSASVGSPEQRRTVTLSGVVEPEAILALAMRAVTQLHATGLSSVEVSHSEASTTDAVGVQAPDPPAAIPAEPASTPKPCEPTPEAATPTRAPITVVVHTNHDSRVRADIALESWGSRTAGAVALGLEQQAGRWSYAFLAGFARPFQQPSLSEVTEWITAAEFGWQASNALGLRISARLGLSLLTADPNDGVATSSGTLKSAAFLQLDLSRPIWLGRFGHAPGVGLRAFSAKRAITIEGQPELQLSTPSVHALIAVLFRVSE